MTHPVIVITEPVIIALIGAALSLATAVLGAVVTIVTLRMKVTLTLLEKNTNSIKDALVATTAENSHAKGKLEGRAEMKQEQRSQLLEASRILDQDLH